MNALDLPITVALIEYYFYGSADYIGDYIDEYIDFLPENLQEADYDDQVEWLCNFLDEHITGLDTVTDYYDLESGYEDNVEILNVDGKIIGVPFSYSSYNGIEVQTGPKTLRDCAEYELIQVPKYARKEPC